MITQFADFAALIDFMQLARENAEEHRPAVFGGRFAHNRLHDFLDAWSIHLKRMPWRIWEHVSDISFTYDVPPDIPNLDYLQRSELFGEGGHLSLRRDANRWLWHFVGVPGTLPPAGFHAVDFWEHESPTLYRYSESVILWGEEVIDSNGKSDVGLWWDDRVAAAKLQYPAHLRGNPRIYLHFWRYTEFGQTSFVWYRELNGQAPSTQRT